MTTGIAASQLATMSEEQLLYSHLGAINKEARGASLLAETSIRTVYRAMISNIASVRIVGILIGLMLIPAVGMADIAASDCIYALRGRLPLGQPLCITEENDDSDGNGGVLTAKLTIPHLSGLNWTVRTTYLKEKTNDNFSDAIDASVVLGTFSDEITLTLTSGGTAPVGYAANKALAETGGWINVTYNLFPLLDTDAQRLTVWVYSDDESAHLMPLPLPTRVPEPDTWMLVSTAIVGLIVFGQRRRKTKPY